MNDCQQFLAFCQRAGDDVVINFLEELCDMEWSGTKKTDRITISASHRHDSCNYTHSGTVKINDIEYGFIIDNGNWNGTVVREWGPADDVGLYEAPRPTLYTYVPANDTLKEDHPAMWSVYLEWLKSKWFEDKVRSYNYDRHFAPGGKTEKHYADWARSKGMKIVSEETANEIISRPKRNLVPVQSIIDALGSETP